ncbi:unnamed protein product [Phytophthora lilii]|uniref:Unnamed protein product n=1 Tax=Phytophthora lilii TaxID=2077276 RepID=A0A9W7CN21_9STRA|nr:unnamed protein product [Phytophthora lilii]
MTSQKVGFSSQANKQHTASFAEVPVVDATSSRATLTRKNLSSSVEGDYKTLKHLPDFEKMSPFGVNKQAAQQHPQQRASHLQDQSVHVLLAELHATWR